MLFQKLYPRLVSVAIWAVTVAVFAADMLTPADDVTVPFAYVIPVVATLLEARPRPMLTGSITSALSILGMVILPPTRPLTVTMNLIAVFTQCLVAALIRLQQRRLDEAQDNAEVQRRFVDILSHEVGTALTTVSGQAYRLTKLSEQLTPGDLRGRAEKIRKAADRIHWIIGRIQFASHLGDGSIPAAQKCIDVPTMIHQVAEQIKDEQGATQIGLTLCAAPKFVLGDEMLLRHVFENVLSNSIKYSPSGTPIAVDVADQGSTLRITISDRGSGIPHDELLRIRTAYYRGQNSRGIRGAGLGLYIVEKVVESHRGHLSIESRVGGGTIVTIDLPNVDHWAVT